MLPDHEIDRLITDKIIGLTPYDPAYLNPASVDLTLHPVLRIPRAEEGVLGLSYPTLDMRKVSPDHTDLVDMTRPDQVDGYEGTYRIAPGQFLLAATNECVRLPNDVVARVEGKSSIGRVGLAVHITAGFIDPGFEGQITLEIANLSPWPIVLRQDMRIAQIAFTVLDSPARAPYGKVGHYQGQTGPTESRYRMAPDREG